MSLPMAALQQQLLSFQLLQYHILMPSLLISKRASECDGCPSHLENMRAASLSNHLAINHLSHMMIGYLKDFQPSVDIDEFCSYEQICKPGKPMPNATTTETTPSTSTTTETTTIPVTATELLPPSAKEFPYVVSIQVTNYHNTKLHLCGGTLISPNWVLTAAHCLDPERPESLVVVVGEQDIGHPAGTGKVIRVDEFFKHPKYVYDKKPYDHDVGLVHLAEDVAENEYVKIASLPNSPLENVTVLCHEPGWGPPRDNAPGSNLLKYTSVPILTKERCNAAYSSDLGEGSICAGQDGVGSCVGDNGGPLICDELLVALMSWREGCAQPGKPAVYMDVYTYLPWIKEITRIG